MLPRPTAKPIADSRKSSLLDQFPRCSFSSLLSSVVVCSRHTYQRHTDNSIIITVSMPFGSSVIAGHGLPPVTAGIGVWLDGVGQAGMYGTAERMNGRTRLHRSQKGIAVNNRTRIEGVVVRIGSRGQDTGYRFCDAYATILVGWRSASTSTSATMMFLVTHIVLTIRITGCSFRYDSPCLWNQLPVSLRQFHTDFSDSPFPAPVSSSLVDSPLSSFRTLSLFQSRHKPTSFANPSRHRLFSFFRTDSTVSWPGLLF